LLDKVVFITGTAGDIGLSICQTCILHGARVVISGICKAAVDDLLAEIITNGNGE
jgi:NAD(P)-dependent dehydrogenase (short-subunit alcohol dehydrogenase family)